MFTILNYRYANARALKYFNKHFDDFADNGSWDFGYNPIIGYDNSLPFDHNNNQLALDYAKLQPAWHDWILGPNVVLSMFINWPVQNSEKRYLNKLQEMELLGLPIDFRAWKRFNY